MQLKIEQLAEKAGTNAQGKPYVLMTVTSGNVRYSCFRGPWNESWRVGDTIEAELNETPNPKGGTYKNLKDPNGKKGSYSPAPASSGGSSSLAELKLMLEELIGIVKNVEGRIKKIENSTVSSPSPFEDGPSDGDIPF